LSLVFHISLLLALLHFLLRQLISYHRSGACELAGLTTGIGADERVACSSLSHESGPGS